MTLDISMARRQIRNDSVVNLVEITATVAGQGPVRCNLKAEMLWPNPY